MTDVNRPRYTCLYLKTFPFFKRLKVEDLEKHFAQLKFEEKTKDDLVLIPSDESIYVILNGKVILREHSLDSPLDYTVI